MKPSSDSFARHDTKFKVKFSIDMIIHITEDDALSVRKRLL